MPNASKLLIAHVLKDLNLDIPSDREIDELIANAAKRVATEKGLNPETFDYALVPVEREWLKGRLSQQSSEE